MVEIKRLRAERLTNGAHFIFISDILRYAENDTVVKTKVAAEIKALKDALKGEDEMLSVSQKDLNTDTIKEYDRRRGRLYGVVRDTIRANLNHPDSETATSAKQLNQRLKDYRIDPEMQLDRETGMLINLIEDLEAEYAPAVAKLNLGVVVAELKSANDKLEGLIKVRLEARANLVKGGLRDARQLADGVYRKLTEKVNALMVVEGAEKYVDYADKMNEEVSHYKSVIDAAQKNHAISVKAKRQVEFDKLAAPKLAEFEKKQNVAEGTLWFVGKVKGRISSRRRYYLLAMKGSTKTIWVRVEKDGLVEVDFVNVKRRKRKKTRMSSD